jgi:hypothetical protein
MKQILYNYHINQTNEPTNYIIYRYIVYFI